eukprot:6889201-Heterocapsa_arctica.AAC.1
MDQQDRQLHEAGEAQQDELSRGHEIIRKFISNDRSSFSLEAPISMNIWSSSFHKANSEYRTTQHQQRLKHFSSLEHTQVRAGQICSRLCNHVNSEKCSRNRLR